MDIYQSDPIEMLVEHYSDVDVQVFPGSRDIEFRFGKNPLKLSVLIRFEDYDTLTENIESIRRGIKDD